MICIYPRYLLKVVCIEGKGIVKCHIIKPATFQEPLPVCYNLDAENKAEVRGMEKNTQTAPAIPDKTIPRSRKTVEQLAKEQGVKPIKDFKVLYSFWPSDLGEKEKQEFLEAVRSARR